MVRYAITSAGLGVLFTLGQLAPSHASPLAAPGNTFVAGSVSCTLGVLLKGSDASLYFTTAGHCAPALGVAPEGMEPEVTVDDAPLGKFVWAEDAIAPFRDTALIRVHPGTAIDPSIIGLGGPTDIAVSPPPLPYRLAFTGGTGWPFIEPTVRPGFSALEPMRDTEADAIIITHAGDSGAAILTCDGFVLGTHHGVTVGWTVDEPSAHGTHIFPLLRPALDRAGEALDITFELAGGSRPFTPPAWC